MLIRNDDIVLRKIADKSYLINIKDNYNGDMCKLYEINEIGDFIWNQLNNPNTLENIVDKLYKLTSSHIDYTTIYNDVEDFIYVLINLKFIRNYISESL